MRVCLVLTAIAAALHAQPGAEFWPGTNYDPAIPTTAKILGYAPGDRISPHAALMRYFDALAASAPNRIKVFEYARSWEGRKLVYAAIGSESNIRRLGEVQAGMRKLADPRAAQPAEARRLIDSLPVLVWLGYGVHGNEISSPDAALLTAYHLLAARKDPVVDSILAHAVVLIDPTQNPDGRDRFVHHFEQSFGLEPQSSPVALEHTEPWPGGRTNHYHFDLNRDWIALTQPETRGRVRALLEWFPQVFVDLHEMGSESTYYFTPEAVPYNPYLTAHQTSALEWFGKNNAKWFDRYGFSYFTREVYDAFYPGYGASWPMFHGAVAMTYEQASARGLVMRRSDDTELTFRDTVRHHFVSSIATCETAARHRKELIENFWNYRVSAVEEGRKGAVREYILPRRDGFRQLVSGPVTPRSAGAGYSEADSSMVDRLARLLADQGIEVERAAAQFRNGEKSYPAGSYRIRLAQPAHRLIRTLLDPAVSMNEEFVKEQDRLRAKRIPNEIYDVTAWSLPLQFNVPAEAAATESEGAFQPLAAASKPAPTAKATVAYAVPWNAAAARLMTALLRAGYRVHASDKAIRQNGRLFPRGTLIAKVKENPDDLHETIARLAAEFGAEVAPTDTGWVEEGVNFGSRFVRALKPVQIAIAWDSPVSAGSAGHARFVLERQYGYPATPVRLANLAQAELSRFHVVVLPDGSYGPTVPTGLAQRLKDFVRDGGTVVGIGGALRYLSDAKTALLTIQREDQPRETAAPKKEATPTTPGKLLAKEEDYRKAIEPDSAPPDAASGALAMASPDPDHWATVGMGDRVYALVSGRDVYAPIKLDQGVNAVTFAAPDQVLASGFLWDAYRKQLAFKPMMIVQPVGRGQVIGFTVDPNYRAYMDGLNLLFLNAVFRGPAHTGPGATELR